MRICPQCSGQIDAQEMACRQCGHDLTRAAAVEPPPAPVSAPPPPVAQPGPTVSDAAPSPDPAATPSQDPERPAEAASAAPGPTAPGRRRVRTLAAAAVAIGAVSLTLLALQPGAPADAPAATPGVTAAADTGPESEPSPVRAPAPTKPKWRGSSDPGLASYGRRAVAFELPAEQTVPVWMKRVRPVLTVRCLVSQTDVFVVTEWAASFEPEAGRHTVRIGFDDGADVEAKWLDSEDGQAFFAPDGVAFARRIARARTMRFGFNPYNADPIVVEFDVTGFDQHVGAVARSCRWRP